MSNAKVTENLFADQLSEVVQAVERALEEYLDGDVEVQASLQEAILYSLLAGGKRLRPALVIFVCEACGGERQGAICPAAAIEMIHTFSLIHDDLPAMDDDDLRRGKPTSHKVFGEGMAVLAGDALVTRAFGAVARYVEDAHQVRRLVWELAHGAGAMINGQAADIHHENHQGDLEAVTYIHTHKTAMMFRASARMGAVSARADDDRVELMGDYGLKIGLAFQIVDDLLDLTSSPKAMGKGTQKDGDTGKLTYPLVAGEEISHRHADALIREAIALIEPLGQRGLPLRQLAQMVVERQD